MTIIGYILAAWLILSVPSTLALLVLLRHAAPDDDYTGDVEREP